MFTPLPTPHDAPQLVGARGRYNIVEPDGYASSDKAVAAFAWNADFRLD